MTGEEKTDFAPAERAPQDEVARQTSNISAISSLTIAFEAIPHIIWALNKQRQIVYSNKALHDYLISHQVENIYGFRPGETLNCTHAFEKAGGCGTTESCSVCGAAQAILASQEGRKMSHECRITRRGEDEPLDLFVTAMPLEVGNETFSIVSAMDISHEKRRRALERIFFHDILNIAGTVKTVSEMMQNAETDEIEKLRSWLYQDVDRLIEEIQAQKDLTAAENNDLMVNRSSLNSLQFLTQTADIYSRHQVAEGRHLVIDPKSEEIDFTSDETLLRRVIGNMLKNALEATPAGGTVTTGCQKDKGHICFRVHNSNCMPREIQLQIFNRSFSTKGPGRGIGTYSIKLLSQRYLKGEVSFTSSEEDGTTFEGRYPLTI